jgi:hypothetical protein
MPPTNETHQDRETPVFVLEHAPILYGRHSYVSTVQEFFNTNLSSTYKVWSRFFFSPLPNQRLTHTAPPRGLLFS